MTRDHDDDGVDDHHYDDDDDYGDDGDDGDDDDGDDDGDGDGVPQVTMTPLPHYYQLSNHCLSPSRS